MRRRGGLKTLLSGTAALCLLAGQAAGRDLVDIPAGNLKAALDSGQVAGAAVDYGRVTDARTALSDALEQSLADLGREPPAAPADEVAALRAGMDDLLGPAFSGSWRIESLSRREGRFVAVVSAEVKTSIARLVGIPEVPVQVTAEAPRAPG